MGRTNKMPDQLDERLRRNQPTDPNARLRDRLRRNPPTMAGSMATAGGPRLEAGIQAGQEAVEEGQRHGIDVLPTAVETGASILGGITPGGPIAGRLASGMASRMGMLAAEIIGRGTGAAAVGVLGSDLMAPSTETPSEKQTRRNISMATSVAGEAGSPLLQQTLTRGILRPIRMRLGGVTTKELLELGTDEAQALMESMGQTLTPGQMRTGRLLDTFENIVAASFGGGQIMGIHRQRAEAAALQTIERAIPGFTKNLSTEDAGLLLQGALKGDVRLDRAATGGAYRAFEAELTKAGGIGEIVNIQSALGKAEKALGVDPKDAGALEVMSALRRSGGEPITFEAAERLRSDLLSIARRGEGILPSRKILANDLAEEVDRAIEGQALALGRYGPAVVNSLAHARAMSRITHQRWDHELIAGLIEQVKPEALPGIVLADNNPTQVRMVREVLFDPKYRIGRVGADGSIVPPVKNPNEVWRNLQSSFVLSHQMQAGGGKYSLLDGESLRRSLDKVGGTARELFRGDEFQNLHTSARAIELIQKGIGSGGVGSGTVAIQMTQAAAVPVMISFISGAEVPGGTSTVIGAGSILLAPIPAALMLTNRSMARWFLQMAKTTERRVGRLAASTAAQTISHLVEQKIPFTWKGADGQETSYDPQTNPTPAVSGQKPQSKF